MLSDKQLNEIRISLEKSNNPIFFFDNDVDGLVSFLLLQRYIERGRGVVIKSYPYLDENHFKKVIEFGADSIFILDKPLVSKAFLELAEKKGIPLVWIDHHEIEEDFTSIKNYYNVFYESHTNEPVSFICYEITKRKKDDWLALIGCIADCFLPPFIEEFKKKYPDLLDFNYKNAFDVLYNTRLGKSIMVLSFGLKDTTTNVVLMMRYLLGADSIYDLFEENNKTKSFLKRYEKINEVYESKLKKAEDFIGEDFVFFTYGGNLSISQDIANALMYKYPDKIIAVGYSNSNLVKFSLRWSEGDIKKITLNAISKIEGATGGGHEHSTGAVIPKDKINEFKSFLSKSL